MYRNETFLQYLLYHFRYYSLKQDYVLYGRVDGKSAKYGSKFESEKVARAVTWFEKFVFESGDDAPDEKKVYLPSCYTKSDIFESFVTHMKTLGFSEETDLIKISCFLNIWSQHFGHVSISPVRSNR